MKDTREEFKYLDGGSKVVMEIRNDRTYLEFSHFHKAGIFKVELDECLLRGKTDAEAYKTLVDTARLVGELVGVFDKMRGE